MLSLLSSRASLLPCPHFPDHGHLWSPSGPGLAGAQEPRCWGVSVPLLLQREPLAHRSLSGHCWPALQPLPCSGCGARGCGALGCLLGGLSGFHQGASRHPPPAPHAPGAGGLGRRACCLGEPGQPEEAALESVRLPCAGRAPGVGTGAGAGALSTCSLTPLPWAGRGLFPHSSGVHISTPAGARADRVSWDIPS